MAKNIDQKKIQERAKRELDAIIQSWRIESSEGMMVIRTEQNESPFQELSYPSGEEEIGSNCSSLQFLFEKDQTKQTTESTLIQVKPLPKLAEIQNTDDLQFAAELCDKVGDVLKRGENPTSSRLIENDKHSSQDSTVLDVEGATYNSIPSARFDEEDSGSTLLSSLGQPVSSDIIRANYSEVQPLSVQQDDNCSNSTDVTNQKNYQCPLCKKHYKTSCHLLRHTKTAHGNQQTHQCNVCDITFTRPESLIRHLKMHEKRDGTNDMCKEGPFKCPKCHKTYQQAYNVKRHLLSHTGEKPFKCTECNKTFTQYTGLSRHLVLHKGSRDFECKECGKTFARLFVLNRHMLTHTDDKPYKCFLCNKSFIRASQLSNHMHSHREKPHEK